MTGSILNNVKITNYICEFTRTYICVFTCKYICVCIFDIFSRFIDLTLTTTFFLIRNHYNFKLKKNILNRNETSTIIVRAGDWDASSENEPVRHLDRFVISATLHHNYKQFNLINDIALLKVDQPFDWSLTIDRVCLDDDDFVPVKCVATGWGQQSYGKTYYTYVH